MKVYGPTDPSGNKDMRSGGSLFHKYGKVLFLLTNPARYRNAQPIRPDVFVMTLDTKQFGSGILSINDVIVLISTEFIQTIQTSLNPVTKGR